MAATEFFLPLLIIALSSNILGAQSAILTIKNNCKFDIWPATVTSYDAPITTGFKLSPQASQTLTVNPRWMGTVWARTQCSGSPLTCQTGDCATGVIECKGQDGKPPASLVEFILQGNTDKDIYDINLAYGFNLPVSVRANTGCQEIKCASDINAVCPKELAFKGSSSSTIGCHSACEALNEPQYCCKGAYSTPATCKPTNYSRIFKNACPQAYSYTYDDEATSSFTCPNGGNYAITFCPV